MADFMLQHLKRPTDIKAHLSGRLILNTSPILRAKDILRYAFERKVTRRNGLVMEYILTGNDKTDTDGAGIIVNNKYFFGIDSIYAGLPLELYFLSFKERSMRPAVRINSETHSGATPIEDYSLVPLDCDPLTYGNTGEGYRLITGYEQLGIDCLADILAYAYRFKYNHLSKAYEVITDPLEITRALRRPYFERLLAGAMEDNINLVQLRSALGVLARKSLAQSAPSPEERPLLELIAQAPISNVADSDAGRTVNAIVVAYESTQLLASDGSNVFDDPLFSFHYA